MKEEMDILREVATTAAAHGSTALSTMLGRRVKLYLPEIDTVNATYFLKTARFQEVVISIQCKILTGLGSRILMTMDEKSASRLIGLCYPAKEETSPGILTEVGLSVIKEVGNVVIGAYVGALSMFLGTVVIPSTPTLLSGEFGDIMNSLVNEKEADYVMVIQAFFGEDKEKAIKGSIEFILTPEDKEKIQKACRKSLEALRKK